MTGNPKALELGFETLTRLTPELTEHIKIMGENFKFMLQTIQKKYPDICLDVTGNGLLLALHINSKYKVDDKYGLEYLCRKNGLNVIHGGMNALRFTPYFLINNNEIELIYKILDYTLKDI